MDSITPTTKTVKSKADYIEEAEECRLRSRSSNSIPQEDFWQREALICSSLAIAAPEASAPDVDLAVCRERDELQSRINAIIAIAEEEDKYFAYRLSKVRNIATGNKWPAEPEPAE